MPLIGLALGPIHPLDLTRAWRYLAATVFAGKEGLDDSTDVVDIALFKVVVRRKVEAAISKTLGFFELNTYV